MRKRILFISPAILLIVFASYFFLERIPKDSEKGVDFGNQIDEIKISYDPTDKFWGENLYKKQYGNVVCEANTITAVGSRLINNFLDLEIYCRDPSRALVPEITILPNPSSTYSGTYLQNFKGQLYSVTSGKVFNFEKTTWESVDDYSGLYLLQPTEDGWVKVKARTPECKKKLTLIFPNQQTYCIDAKQPSAVLVWDGHIFS